MGVGSNSEGLNKWFVKAHVIVSLLLLTSLFFIEGLELNFLSVTLSLVFFGLISFSLYYISNIWFEALFKPSFIPLLYLVLVLSNPYALIFSKFHVVALLIIWGLFFNIKYLLEEQKKISSLFLSILFLSSASLLIPQIFWLLLLLFITDIWSTKIGVFRYFATFIGALIIPALYYVPAKIFIYKETFSNIVSKFSNSLFKFSLPQVAEYTYFFLLFIIGLLVIISVISLFRESKYLKLTHTRALKRVAEYGAVLILLFFFYNISTNLYQLLIYVPLSLLFVFYFTHYKNKPIAKTLLVLLLSAIILFRIDAFI